MEWLKLPPASARSRQRQAQPELVLAPGLLQPQVPAQEPPVPPVLVQRELGPGLPQPQVPVSLVSVQPERLPWVQAQQGQGQAWPVRRELVQEREPGLSGRPVSQLSAPAEQAVSPPARRRAGS